MTFKNKEERIDYAIGTFAMKSGFTYEQVEKFYNEKSEHDKQVFLDTFAFDDNAWGK